MAVSFENVHESRLDFWEEVDEFDETGKDDCSGRRRAALEFSLKCNELFDRTAALVFSDEMAKLAQDVSANFDQGFMTVVCLDILQDILCGIDLKLLVICNDLNDSVPHLITHVVTCHRDEA